MAGMNGVIHLVAALALAGLVFLWLKARRHNEFLRMMTGPVRSKGILVGWPEKFVRDVAETCGILLSGNYPSGGNKEPVTIDLREWRAFLRSFEVEVFRLEHLAGADSIRLIVEVSSQNGLREARERESWDKRLSKALGLDVKLNISDRGLKKDKEETQEG